MRANEIRRYCGLIQNKIEEKYKIKTSSTSCGQTIWIKKDDCEKLNGDFKLTYMGKNWFVIMVTKSLIKKFEF